MATRPRTAPQAARRLLGLAVLVALLHAALLSRWAALQDERPSGAASPRTVVLLSPRVLPTPTPAPVQLPAPADAASPLPQAMRARTKPTAADVAPIVAPAPVVAAPPVRVTAAPDAAPPPDDAAPPPVYPTRVPAPAVLLFAASANGGDATDAELRWQHDGERYRLQLRVGGSSPRPLVDQLSEGGFDAAGLAPQRFVDRRRGRYVGAAHFRRDIGRISFSGPPGDYPAWPGAQDRLAWLPQLVAVLAAAAAPPDELRLFVADARGVARTWIFRSQGLETVDTAVGPVTALKLLREPPRVDDLRVAVWLDPAAGWWPARIEFTVPVSGYAQTLLRSASGPAEPPAAAPGP